MLAPRAILLLVCVVSMGAAGCRDGDDLFPLVPSSGAGGAVGGAGDAGGSGGAPDGGQSDVGGGGPPADAGSSGDAGNPGAFTLVVLPDTQYYSLVWPHVFTAQTAWIAQNVRRLNVPYVLHLGDITDQNTTVEWQRAAAAMSLLDGLVPYALATGNHDFGPFGHPATRDTLLNAHFPFGRMAGWKTFGGAYEDGKLENTYHLFSAGGRDFIVIALEWAPRDPVIAWANRVMIAHPHRSGILITHAYMNNNDRRYDYTEVDNPQNRQDFNPHQYPTPGGVNDGEELWQKLVRKHRFVMTLNGHVLGDGTGYLASVTDRNNTCHQMLSNYQFRQLGGEGYLRLLEFRADGRTVKVSSYSPLLSSFLNEPDQSFSFVLD